MQRFGWISLGAAILVVAVWRPWIPLEPSEPSPAETIQPAPAASAAQRAPSKAAFRRADPAVATRAASDKGRPGATEASKRANLYDAPNVLRAVERALASGTPDEKGWAAEVFRECFGFWPNKKFDGRIAPDAAVAALQQEAFASLIARCDGVYVTGWEDRKEMLAALTSAAESSTSAYRLLKVLQQRHSVGDSRWQPAEANLLATALYGGDGLLRREAFQVLVGAIDKNAPGGSDRYYALGIIMQKEHIDNPLTSDFERLQQCYFLGMCRGESTLPAYHFPNAEPEPDPGPAIHRLSALYLDALSRRLSPAEILAIR